MSIRELFKASCMASLAAMVIAGCAVDADDDPDVVTTPDSDTTIVSPPDNDTTVVNPPDNDRTDVRIDTDNPPTTTTTTTGG